MKTNDALEILHKAFSEYSFHYQFIKELGEITKKGAVVFLCAFYERSGHHKTSYQDFLPVLEQRFREIQGVDDYE